MFNLRLPQGLSPLTLLLDLCPSTQQLPRGPASPLQFCLVNKTGGGAGVDAGACGGSLGGSHPCSFSKGSREAQKRGAGSGRDRHGAVLPRLCPATGEMVWVPLLDRGHTSCRRATMQGHPLGSSSIVRRRGWAAARPPGHSSGLRSVRTPREQVGPLVGADFSRLLNDPASREKMPGGLSG